MAGYKRFEGCPSRVTSGKHLGLIDLRVGIGLAMAVDRLLRFPMLVEQELRVVGRRVIDLEAGAARLLARVLAGLDQQARGLCRYRPDP